MTTFSLLALEDLGAGFMDHISGDSIFDMSIRAVLVYAFALLLVRLGKKRMLSGFTVFDIILTFILGSTLSRAINGDAPLLPSLLAASLLVAVHALIGRLSYHSHTLGKLFKGESEPLIRDGEYDEKALHAHHLSHHDLDEAIRKAGLQHRDQVKEAYIERDGSVSIIPRFRVVEVEAEDGVQRIRIEI